MPSGLAVVTGGSRGLGRELALALAREGYDLLVCSRGAKDLGTVWRRIEDLGRRCHVWQGDLGTDTESFIEFLEARPIEVLVNNAALAPRLMRLEDQTASDYHATLSLNLYAPYRLMQAAVRSMKPRGSGTIVNICSLSGRRAIRNASLYCATKFALRGMTESLGQELEGSGIRCFSVSPGGMNTSLRQQLLGDAAQQQDPAAVAQIIVDAIAGRIPVGQGEDLVVRGGQYTVVPRERWVGITLNPGQIPV